MAALAHSRSVTPRTRTFTPWRTITGIIVNPRPLAVATSAGSMTICTLLLARALKKHKNPPFPYFSLPSTSKMEHSSPQTPYGKFKDYCFPLSIISPKVIVSRHCWSFEKKKISVLDKNK